MFCRFAFFSLQTVIILPLPSFSKQNRINFAPVQLHQREPFEFFSQADIAIGLRLYIYCVQVLNRLTKINTIYSEETLLTGHIAFTATESVIFESSKISFPPITEVPLEP